MTTAAPAAASPLAIPSPIPPFPPVTKATRFCRLKIVIAISLRWSEDSGMGGGTRQSSGCRLRPRFATVWSHCQTVDVEGEPKMATVKVGLVGCGFVAHLHMYAYKRVYGVDLQVRAVAARGDHVVNFAKQ